MNGAQTVDTNHLGTALSLVLDGNIAALNTLLAKLRPYLHLLVREHMGSDRRYGVDGSDLVQETLMRIYRGLDPDRGVGVVHFHGTSVPQFLNWVGVIVRNVVAAHLKYRKAAKRDEGREVSGSKIFPLLIAGMTSEQQAERDEQAIHLAAALERLSGPRQNVIRARFFDGLSFEEISRQTGKSAGALRVLTLRAINQLRTIMESSS